MREPYRVPVAVGNEHFIEQDKFWYPHLWGGDGMREVCIVEGEG